MRHVFLAIGAFTLISATPKFAEQSVIGSSVQKREIAMNRYGSGPEKVLIIGGVHGDELPSVPLVTSLEAELNAFWFAYPKQTIYVIPCLNPDGQAAGTRVNANGVDLNRNMDSEWSEKHRSPRSYPGPKPYSEPESRALRDVITQIKPDRIMSVHAFADILDFDTDQGKALAERMSKLNKMKVETIGYPTPGSLGRFCSARNIPLVTLELPPGVSDKTMFNWQRQALWNFIRS